MALNILVCTKYLGEEMYIPVSSFHVVDVQGWNRKGRIPSYFHSQFEKTIPWFDKYFVTPLTNFTCIWCNTNVLSYLNCHYIL